MVNWTIASWIIIIFNAFNRNTYLVFLQCFRKFSVLHKFLKTTTSSSDSSFMAPLSPLRLILPGPAALHKFL